MNKLISTALAQSLINLDYITRASGCIEELKIPSKGGKGFKNVPAAREVFTAPSVCESGAYKDMVPNSAEVGIIYFEDLGTRREKAGRLEKWRGTMRLVCWLQVGESCGNVYTTENINTIIASVREAVTQDLTSNGQIVSGKVWAAEEYPKRPSPFEKYDYNEKETQFLMYPYEYFSLKIEYFVVALGHCTITSIEIPQIEPASARDLHYTHNQPLPSDVWTVTHNLGKKPSVTVVDTSDTVVIGRVDYTDLNTVVLTFIGAFAGKAYFN